MIEGLVRLLFLSLGCTVFYLGLLCIFDIMKGSDEPKEKKEE